MSCVQKNFFLIKIEKVFVEILFSKVISNFGQLDEDKERNPSVFLVISM